MCIERDDEGEWYWPPHVFYGGMFPGTVNVSELLPYIQTLGWYIEHTRAEDKKRHKEPRLRTVRIVTDSQYTEEQGGKPGKTISKKNRGFWTLFAQLERQGLVVHWHHAKRETLDLNVFADKISKIARIALKESTIPKEIEEKFG